MNGAASARALLVDGMHRVLGWLSTASRSWAVVEALLWPEAPSADHPETAKPCTALPFWEPVNWCEIDECRKHRKEVEEFADKVAASSIPFQSMTYAQLWQE